MKSAILELFHGTFAQIENLKPTAKQIKSLDLVIEYDEKLTKLIKDNQEALDVYKQFKHAMEESTYAETVTFYKEGFRNGFQIALDAMDED